MSGYLTLTTDDVAVVLAALRETSARRQRTAMASAPRLAAADDAGVDVGPEAMRLMAVLNEAARLTILAESLEDQPDLEDSPPTGPVDPDRDGLPSFGISPDLPDEQIGVAS